MPNIKFIGTSTKDNYKRLYCQVHLRIAKRKYEPLKIPLKSLVTGKAFVVRKDILSPKSSNGLLVFLNKKMSGEELRIAKEIKDLMSLMQLAINEIISECSSENRVLLPTDLTTISVYDRVAKLSDVRQSPLVNATGEAKEKKEVFLDAYWGDFVEKIKNGTILYNGTKYVYNQ